MKIATPLLIASSIYGIVESAYTGLKPPRISLDASAFRRSLSHSSSICSQDMDIIEANVTLNESMIAIDKAFDADMQDPRNLCAGVKIGTLTEMNCLVDYQKYSAEFESQCVQLGGTTYPVTLLMVCEGPIAGGEFELEMELINVPFCVGTTCQLGEVYNALLDIFDSTENSVSEFDMQCQYFHDYDSLSNTPHTIQIQDTQVAVADADDVNGASIKGSVTAMVFAVGLGLLLTL